MAAAIAFFLVVASFLLLVATEVSTAQDQPFKEVPYARAPAVAPKYAPPVPLVPPPPSPALPSPTPTPVLPSPTVPLLPPVKGSECPRLCGGRCKLHSRPRHCQRVCITCCRRCKCVPTGTYGNKMMCGKCYTDMTTHGGKPKCP